MSEDLFEVNAYLKAEVDRLTKAHSDALADFWAIHKGYFDLKAEVERLRKFNDEALAHIAKEERKSRECLDMAQAEVERLRASSFVTAVPVEEYEKLKAEVERLYRNGDLMLKFAAANMTYPAYATMAKDWLATKEGKPSV